MHLRQVPLLIASFAFPACVGSLEDGSGVGGGGGGDDVGDADAGTVETVNYEMEVTPALGEIELGQQVSFTAEISSENFAGPVTLDLVGALDTWEVLYTPSQTIDLAANQTASVVVSLQVPTNGVAGTGALTFALSGELGTRAGNAQMNVANQITFAIPAGAGEGNHNMAGAMLVREGTNLIWTNNDTIEHQIHSSPHGDSFGPGASYSFAAELGTEEAYCHDHAGGSGTLTIMVEENP